MFRRLVKSTFLTLLTLAIRRSGGAGGFRTAQNVYIQHNLTSDVLGLADFTDPNLVDPWGACPLPPLVRFGLRIT